MSVIMTMRVSGDPARFEETVAANAEAIGRIMDVAKRNGLIAHRWYGSDGEFMAVDEWPDQESLHGAGAAGHRAGHGGGRRDVTTERDVLAHARHGRRRRLGSLSSAAQRRLKG